VDCNWPLTQVNRIANAWLSRVMIRHFLCIAFSALTVMGCNRQSAAPPSKPEVSAQLPDVSPAKPEASAQSVEISSGTNLTASMTDVQILRALGCDPDTLTSYREHGKDGRIVTYSNDTVLVSVTRSVVSGVSVVRQRPEGQKQEWLLGKP
jgi:hypothetical protein